MHPTGLAAVLAHQGGWDEALLVAGPVVVIIAVLAVVKRRVDRQVSADDGGPLDVGPDGS